jgi:hypothetical protein
MPAVQPPIIYHYTTGDGLLGIIERSVLYATDMLYMNDSREADYAVSVIIKIIEGIVADASMYPEPNQRKCANELSDFSGLISGMHVNRPTCASCFCVKGDLLSQWRAYGATGGFAIGFDRALLSQMVSTGGLAAVSYDWIAQGARIAALIKRTMESEELTNEASTKRLALNCAADLWFNALFFKDEAFSEEQEWRLVARVDEDRLKFRMSKVGLTPYIEVDLPPGSDSPIREIIVGPCNHPLQTERAVRLLLRRFNLTDVAVAPSKISLRL